METIKQAFLSIREASRHNEDILGFVATGSRGKELENQWSDYDFAIFVTNEALEKHQEKYENLPADGRHTENMTPAFANDAEWRISWIGAEVKNGRLP